MLFLVAIILPEVARAAAPVALFPSYQWDMGKDMVIERPFGLQVKFWFNNTDTNTTYSCRSREMHWNLDS
jgi:hypothetical protein